MLTDAPPLTREALAYAARAHAGQRRRVDGAPFITHPVEVALLLQESGAPDHVVAAGVLHDVIEKSGVDGEDLREQFGDDVADLVIAVSEDEDIVGYAARKAALREQVRAAGDEALTVFAADKVSKARELRFASSPAARQVRHLRHSLELLEELAPASPFVSELRRELLRAA
jgi:(p)ppGpp synthase/HD superfamily hydrolase